MPRFRREIPVPTGAALAQHAGRMAGQPLEAIILFAPCCGLNGAPQNSYVETLPHPRAMAFGDGAFRGRLRLNEVMRVGLSRWDWYPYWKRAESFMCV